MAEEKKVRKRKHHQVYSASDIISGYYYRSINRPMVEARIAMQKLVAFYCEELFDIPVPEVNLCDVDAQNECIRHKNAVPCGGGCYRSSPKPIIYMREQWFKQDTLLHELFHHIDSCNNSKAISQIMYGWHSSQFSRKRNYVDTMRRFGITKPPVYNVAYQRKKKKLARKRAKE